jgi:hypothetical protein
MVTPKKKRLHDELSECFKVLDTCLRCYYSGETHMYRPMAGQLRILFCDSRGKEDNSLLCRTFRSFQLSRVRPIEWVEPSLLPSRTDDLRNIRMNIPEDWDVRIAKMPFVIREYGSGLQIADLDMEDAGPLLPFERWVDQEVTIYPQPLTICGIIRTVANKGGGAHVDSKENTELRLMRAHGPAGLGVNVLFIVALARFAQHFGVHYAQFRKQCGYSGSFENIVFDPNDDTAQTKAKIPEDIELSGGSIYHLTVVKRLK